MPPKKLPAIDWWKMNGHISNKSKPGAPSQGFRKTEPSLFFVWLFIRAEPNFYLLCGMQ
jgi:hypothetical protein